MGSAVRTTRAPLIPDLPELSADDVRRGIASFGAKARRAAERGDLTIAHRYVLAVEGLESYAEENSLVLEGGDAA